MNQAPGRPFRLVLTALVVGSVALQLTLLLANARVKPVLDETSYLRYSKEIMRGGGMSRATRPPLYPYARALAHSVAPEGVPARLSVGVLQVAVSSLTMVLLCLLTRDLFGARAGLVAAGLIASTRPSLHTVTYRGPI